MESRAVQQPLSETVKGLVELIKPRQTALLLLTLVGSYLAAGGRSLYILLLATSAGFLTIAGTTALNMVFDRDVDMLMGRTRSRPLPSGRVSPRLATLYGTVLFTVGLALAHMVSKLYAIIALLGFVFDIPLYTNLAKRRTWLNIFIGSGAGAMPAIGGWVAARGVVEPAAIVLGLMVVTWIPMHIWFIAAYYLDDYRKARVPMAPVTIGLGKTIRIIQASLAAFALLSWVFVLLKGYGYIAAVAASVEAAAAIMAAERFKKRPAREIARTMFKLANPILALVFIALSVEAQVMLP